jgi:excisionase family DNA binding protein
MPEESSDRDDLLRPREVAQLFGVRPTTIARWAREGKLNPFRTPGSHRRYSRAAIRRLLAEVTQDEDEQQWVEDAVRLYEQGWGIRQVADKFDCSYGVMRRILGKHLTLRNRGGNYTGIYRPDRD